MFTRPLKSPLVSVGLGLAFACSVLPPALAAPPPATMAPAASTALPWQQVRLLADVMQLIKQDYVQPVSDTTLLNSAMRGMLSGLDPHSAFLDAQDYQQMQVITSGEFGGLGLEVTEENGAVVVVSPIDGTPAAKAGVRSGDVIVKVNGTALDGLSLDDAVALMRGAPGSQVSLTVLRKGVPQALNFNLTRTEVHVASVHSRLLQPGYGYMRISQFSEDTSDGVHSALHALAQRNHAPLKGLILDLRDNPGGLLDAAVDVSGDFLNRGVIVIAKGRAPDSNFERRAMSGDLLHGTPMVVLVNGGTASAAEITAGALQDNHRAVILGTRTFGKGSVQTVIPLPQGAALKLTTSLYYTPSGHSIQAEGIRPDIMVPEFQVGTPAAGENLAEADLEGHLANTAPTPQTPGNLRADDQLAQQDFQLYQALNVLKGLSVAANH